MPTADREDSVTGWNTMFRVLGNEYRRRLLTSLLDHNDQVKLSETVSLGGPDWDALQTQFVHNHLPMLEEVGYIEWDQDSQQVVKGPRFDEIRPLLTLIEDHRDELPEGWV